MDWKKIKAEAKQKNAGKLWDIWKPILVVALLSMVISLLVEVVFGPSIKYDFKSLSEGFKVEYNYPAIIASSVFSLLVIPATVGSILYMLNFVRGKEYSLNDLKAFYPKIGTLIIIDIVVAVLVSLGFALFVIPGIIIGLMLYFVFYIFVDNPELSWSDCLKKSCEMTKGYKGDLFGFALSFIGWILLCCFVIPVIWVAPYITTSMTIYYDELKKKTNN